MLTLSTNNVFTSFLSFTGVKYTQFFSDNFYAEHPHKYNLFGLSKMLSDYRIENRGIRIENKKENIHLLDTPFIAHITNDFVPVFKVTPEKVHCIWHGQEIIPSIDDFCDIWSGVILLAETTENSIEPNYKEHRKKELVSLLEKGGLVIGICVLLILGGLTNKVFNGISSSLNLIINLAGVYIGYLLVLKQINFQSNYVDKICSLFKQSDCNNILESKAAKLFGVLGWSEIGLGYFISNIIILLFIPALIPYYALINICSLPYTLWSIWYQKVIAKQWCPLCIIVQILLWSIFLVNILTNSILIPDFSISDILLSMSMYTIPLLTINLFSQTWIKGSKIEKMTQEINSLKATEEVFEALLLKQPYYTVSKQTSQILFGNSDSNTLITVLTNPHCEPCGKMHKQIKELLSAVEGRICVQYIFSSFNHELDSSNKYLIATYLNNNRNEMEEKYDKWFETEKYRKDDLVKKYDDGFTDKEINEEFNLHEKWKEDTKLRTTPTILINGYALPHNYKIGDLRYFY